MSDKLLIDRELVDNLYLQTGEGQLRNLPTAQFLDLEGVEVWSLYEVQKLFRRGDEFVLKSDLRDKLLPLVVGPTTDLTFDELHTIYWEAASQSETNQNNVGIRAILDRIKGGK